MVGCGVCASVRDGGEERGIGWWWWGACAEHVPCVCASVHGLKSPFQRLGAEVEQGARRANPARDAV